MKFVKVIAISLIGMASLLCAGAAADQPATRPADSSSFGNPQGRRMRTLAAKNNAFRPYTQQEWDEMMTFMLQYSPTREHLLEEMELPHDSPIRLDAIRKWRNYNFTKEHFPAIADDLIQRFRLEDDLLYLSLKTSTAEGSDRLELRDKIHDKVAQLVNLELTERQARIDKLQKMLEEEKTTLVQDKSSEQERIDRRTSMIMMRIDRRNPEFSPPPSTRPDRANSADNIAPDAAPASPDPVMNGQ